MSERTSLKSALTQTGFVLGGTTALFADTLWLQVPALAMCILTTFHAGREWGRMDPRRKP